MPEQGPVPLPPSPAEAVDEEVVVDDDDVAAVDVVDTALVIVAVVVVVLVAVVVGVRPVDEAASSPNRRSKASIISL